jgi:hypothetical protein
LRVIQSNDLVAYEDLNVKGMARSKLAKSINKVKKSLSTRTHKCPHCRYEPDRDVNASINILQLGLRTAGHAGTYASAVLGRGCDLNRIQVLESPLVSPMLPTRSVSTGGMLRESCPLGQLGLSLLSNGEVLNQESPLRDSG